MLNSVALYLAVSAFGVGSAGAVAENDTPQLGSSAAIADGPMSKAEHDCRWGETPEARIKGCTRYIRTEKNPRARAAAYNNRGRDRDGLGQTDLVIKDLNQATRLWPELGGPYIDRAIIYIEQGDAAAAIREYDAFLKHHPDDQVGLDCRCWARALAGTDLDRALADCERAIQINAYKATYYEDRALIWFRRGDMRRVVRDTDLALMLDPNSPRALYLRGLARTGEGRTDEGQADIAAAQAADKAAVTFLVRWGVR